ncbi:MAG: hypothetical protein AABY07_01410 [Nanoarchaeota archaeon]
MQYQEPDVKIDEDSKWQEDFQREWELGEERGFLKKDGWEKALNNVLLYLDYYKDLKQETVIIEEIKGYISKLIKKDPDFPYYLRPLKKRKLTKKEIHELDKNVDDYLKSQGLVS